MIQTAHAHQAFGQIHKINAIICGKKKMVAILA